MHAVLGVGLGLGLFQQRGQLVDLADQPDQRRPLAVTVREGSHMVTGGDIIANLATAPPLKTLARC